MEFFVRKCPSLFSRFFLSISTKISKFTKIIIPEQLRHNWWNWVNWWTFLHPLKLCEGAASFITFQWKHQENTLFLNSMVTFLCALKLRKSAAGCINQVYRGCLKALFFFLQCYYLEALDKTETPLQTTARTSSLSKVPFVRFDSADGIIVRYNHTVSSSIFKVMRIIK